MHCSTARDVYDQDNGLGSFDLLTGKEYEYWRGEAKAVNFGLMYGANPKTELEKRLQAAFFTRYPEVAKWQSLVEVVY